MAAPVSTLAWDMSATCRGAQAPWAKRSANSAVDVVWCAKVVCFVTLHILSRQATRPVNRCSRDC